MRLLPDPERGSGEVAVVPGYAPWLPTTWQQDAKQMLEAIGPIGKVDWIIVDHYGLDARWGRVARNRGVRILVVDDLADRSHDCDLLLDQNLVLRTDARYRNRVPATCRQLLGPHYALLRREFAEQRKSLIGRSGEVRCLLVCYGGSDPANETVKALGAIKDLSDNSLAIDVVIGLSNPHADLVSRRCLELPRAELLAKSISSLRSDPARARAMGETALALVGGEGGLRVRAEMASVGSSEGCLSALIEYDLPR